MGSDRGGRLSRSRSAVCASTRGAVVLWLILAAIALSLAGHVHAAEAQTSAREDNERTSDAIAESSGRQTTNPCDDECKARWRAEQSIKANVSSARSNEILTQLREVREKVGVAPKITSLGRLSVQGVAITVAWYFGDHAKKKVIEWILPAAPGGRTGCTNCVIVDEEWLPFSENETFRGTSIPEDGWVYTYYVTDGISMGPMNASIASCENDVGVATQQPAGTKNLPAGGGVLCKNGGIGGVHLAFRALRDVQPQPQARDRDADSPAATHNTDLWSDWYFTPEELRKRVGDALATNKYRDAELWLDHLTNPEWNPDPLIYEPPYLAAPSCVGVAVTTCTARFRSAGFTGTVTTTTLSAADAVMEKPAREVTDTVPPLGSRGSKAGSVEIWENPSTMPVMTATETEVANGLKATTPDTVDGGNEKTLARRCVRYTAQAGRSASDCNSLPILVQGSDTAEPARNEAAALIRNPSWVALNRRVSTTNPRWYQNQPGCTSASRPDGSHQCDEFPFWSTLQANGGTLSTLTPSIRWTPSHENNRQSNVLRQFYSTRAAGPSVPFRGCGITAQAVTDPAPIIASTFLNVPAPPGLGIRSVGICNQP